LLRFRINLAFHAQCAIVILGLKDHWCWLWPWKNGLKPFPNDFIFGGEWQQRLLTYVQSDETELNCPKW